MRVSSLAAALCLASAGAAAQTVAPPPPPAQSPPPSAAQPPPAACCRVPAGTPVVVEIVDPLSSKTQKAGDKFNLRLAGAIVVDGETVAPAGAAGVGEVIDAEPPGMGGRAGRLILAARYVESGGVRIPLRAMRLSASGKDYSDAALATSAFVGVFGLAVQGGNVDYPTGTRANAKVAADVTLPAVVVAPAPPGAAADTPGSAPSSTPADKGPTP
jgi:hypothetical protein